MTEEPPKRYRISISRKGLRGQVFASMAAEIDNPNDPEEVRQVIDDLKSPGMTSIAEALSDRLDDEIEAGISRIRGERRERIGYDQVPPPQRKKTAAAPPPPGEPEPAPFVPSTGEQRNRIRQIVLTEDKAEGHPAKRNFLHAILKKEGAGSLNEISFDGAEKVLQQIDEDRAKEVEVDFVPATKLDDEDLRDLALEADLDRDRAKAASIAKEEGDMETYDRMMDELHERAQIRAEKLGLEPPPRSGFAMLEGPDGGELTEESKEVQLEVAKSEADEMDGVDQ